MTVSGFTELGTSADAEFLVGGLGFPTDAMTKTVVLTSATTDPNNTPVTNLRRGLLVSGAADGTSWTDGNAGAELGILWSNVEMLDDNGTAEAQPETLVLRAGTIRESGLPDALAGPDKTTLEGQGFIFV